MLSISSNNYYSFFDYKLDNIITGFIKNEVKKEELNSKMKHILQVKEL